MKRYIVFGSYPYEACGGEGDEIGRVNSRKAAVTLIKEKSFPNCEVLDLKTGKWLDIDKLTK